MKMFVLMITAMIIVCYPKDGFSQAVINGNNSVSVYDPVPLEYVNTIYHTYSMDGFVDNEEYKIVASASAPFLTQNLQMYSGGVTIGSDVQFTFSANSSFMLSYYLSVGTAPGQLEPLKFQIYRKRPLGIWDWQSTFFYDLNTTCRTDYTLSAGGGYPLYLSEYEVSGNLSVINYAAPGNFVMDLDGGQSVSLLPGFYTDLTSGGAVLVINDGCGGVYRTANPSSENTVSLAHPNLKVNDLVVYPNPVSDKCKIHLPKDAIGKNLKIEIMDLNGRILYSENKTYDQDMEADMTGFKSGLYFITISGDDINYNKKVMKE